MAMVTAPMMLDQCQRIECGIDLPFLHAEELGEGRWSVCLRTVGIGPYSFVLCEAWRITKIFYTNATARSFIWRRNDDSAFGKRLHGNRDGLLLDCNVTLSASRNSSNAFSKVSSWQHRSSLSFERWSGIATSYERWPRAARHQDMIGHHRAMTGGSIQCVLVGDAAVALVGDTSASDEWHKTAPIAISRLPSCHDPEVRCAGRFRL